MDTIQQALDRAPQFKPVRVTLPPLPMEADLLQRLTGPAGTASIAYFVARAMEELADAARTKEPLACMAVRVNGAEPDVTRLHPIHAAKLVADFSRFLVEMSGQKDLVCCKGAGTFLILAPGTSRLRALRLADRVLWEIRDRPWRVAEYSVELTCSVSISSMRSPQDMDLVRRALDAVRRAAAVGDPLTIAA